MAIETNELIDVQTLSPFKKFIMTIGNLPTSYLESMTYGEMLMWFCNYLQETVIPTVNNNGLAVEELQGLYVELKNYVDSYFDDLDLQEEVNIKLDEMALNGTLTRLIKDYIDPIQEEYEEQVNSNINLMNSQINQINRKVDSLSSGSPLVASSISDMTDTTKTYVLTTDGYWYYYDGSDWVQGGLYQTAEDSDTVNKLVSEVGMISEHTYNLWENDSEYSFTKLEDLTLERELAVGTYTFSAEITSSNTAVSIVPYNGQNASATRQQLTPNTGNRVSVTFTTTATTNRIILYAGTTTSNSVGQTAVYTNIQIVSGEDDKPYTDYLTAYDKVARSSIYGKVNEETFTNIGKNYNYWVHGNVTSAKKNYTSLNLDGGIYTLSFICNSPSSFMWYAYETNTTNQIGSGSVTEDVTTRQSFIIDASTVDHFQRIYFNVPDDVTIEDIQLEKRVYYRCRWNYTQQQVVTEQLPYVTDYINPNSINDVLSAKASDSYWNNKIIYFNGDSITAGTAGEQGLDEGVAYVNTIGDILRFKTIRNYAVGGSRCAVVPDIEQPSLVERISDMGNDADIIFIMINTNDYASQVPIGNDNSTNTSEFKGALNYIFSYLRETYPEIPVIISTMPTRKPNYANDVELPIHIEQYVQAVIDMVHKYKFILYDAYYDLGLDWRYEWIHRADGYHTTRDGLHPNQLGAEWIGRKIAEFIKEQ